MKVFHCPQHIGVNTEPNVRAFASVRPTLGGFTEMDHGARSTVHVLFAILGSLYHICVGKKMGPHSHSQEAPAVVRKRLWITGVKHQTIQISQSVGTPGGIGMDRHLTIVRFRWFGFPCFYLTTHTDAAIQDLDTGAVHEDKNPRARLTAKAMQTIEDTLHTLIVAEKRHGFITADFNYKQVGLRFRLTDAQLWQHSPQKMFTRLGMHWQQNGLDYVGWTSGWKVKSFRWVDPGHEVSPGHRNGADHAWGIGVFGRVWGRKKRS